MNSKWTLVMNSWQLTIDIEMNFCNELITIGNWITSSKRTFERVTFYFTTDSFFYTFGKGNVLHKRIRTFVSFLKRSDCRFHIVCLQSAPHYRETQWSVEGATNSITGHLLVHGVLRRATHSNTFMWYARTSEIQNWNRYQKSFLARYKACRWREAQMQGNGEYSRLFLTFLYGVW